MALRQKPIERPSTDELKIDAIIDRGGSVPSAKKNGRKSNYPLRFMQENMPDRIEAARNKRPMPPSINTWINEAMLEKLEREGC